MGMRLFANEYWKCAETACINGKMSNLKFVFSESLIENNSSKKKHTKKFSKISITFYKRFNRSNNNFYGST